MYYSCLKGLGGLYVRVAIFSLRLFHFLDEAGEEIMTVLRAGRGFRVILHREDRLAVERQAAIRPVEQRDMGLDHPLGQAGAIDGEAVIHGSDLDLAGDKVLDRMIGAVMALMHLFGLCA